MNIYTWCVCVCNSGEVKIVKRASMYLIQLREVRDDKMFDHQHSKQ